MKQLYKYHGTVSSIGFNGRGCGVADLVLGDISDWDKPPVRVAAHGALAKYINDIEGTDAEERYIKADWYYDRNLFLHRIEILCVDGSLAKVITNAEFLSEELVIFGPKDYIEDAFPEPMDQEQARAWYEFRAKY